MKQRVFTVLTKCLPSSLWQQIFGSLIILVVIPLFSLWFVLVGESQEGIKNSVLRDYQEIAVRATGEVEATIKAVQQSLDATAAIAGTIHADPWRVETAITELSLKYPIFQKISLIGLSGMELATSQLGAVKQDLSNDPAFLSGLKGQKYISAVNISQEYLPVMTISVPIKERGQITGVLFAEINLREIWNIVDSIHIGKTGFAYLIDQRGSIIAHPDKKLVLKNSHSVYPEISRTKLEQNASSVTPEGWLMSYSRIVSLDWVLIIEQPINEAFAFLDEMKQKALVLIIFTFMATVGASLLLAGLMSRPIKSIMDATQLLSRGEFPAPFRIRRRDEIGRLMFVFNRMIVKLKNAQQMERFSMIGKAATTIAHELKNSLVLIKTFIQLLPERHRDPKFIQEFSRTIPKELDSWNAMLHNLMEISKPTDWDKSDLDINGIVSDVVELAKLRATLKGVTITFEKADWLPEFQGDRSKLNQAFINLISNAVDAASPGGTVKLFTKLIKNERKNMDAIQIVFQNSGHGIPQEQLKKIFEPFYTTKENGLGLGLSICQEIIKRHGGEISAYSMVMNQTEFVVKLFIPGITQKLEPRSIVIDSFKKENVEIL